MSPRAPFFAIAFAIAACASCYDPAHADSVAQLGPEADGVPAGVSHRPGQPCLTCHGGSGPAARELSVAGTVFAAQGSTQPAPGVTVIVTDATNATRTAVTNDAGNFFIDARDWDPAFSLRVKIQPPTGKEQRMTTAIGRDGGCATCHRGAGDTTHMPSLFVSSP